MKLQSHATVRDVLRTFLQQSKRHPFLFVGMTISLVIAVILSAIYPLYYKNFFDILSTAERVDMIKDQLQDIILFILFLHMGEYVAYRAASFLDTFYTARMMAHLRDYAFEKVMEQSYGFFINTFTGAIVQRVNRLATSFQKFNDRVYWHLLGPMVRLIAIIGILSFQSAQLTIIMAVFVLLLIILNLVFARWKIRYDIRRAREDSHTTAVLADALTNNDTIRLFHCYGHEKQRFGGAVERLRRASVITWLLSNINDCAQALLFIGVLFAVFYVGVNLWFTGFVSLGILLLVFTYYMQIQRQLWELPRTIRDIFESIADAKEMVEIINLKPDILDASDAKELRITGGEVRFSNVTFWYVSSKSVFRDLELTIKAGERIAFVGLS